MALNLLMLVFSAYGALQGRPKPVTLNPEPFQGALNGGS